MNILSLQIKQLTNKLAFDFRSFIIISLVADYNTLSSKTYNLNYIMKQYFILITIFHNK